FGIDATYAYWWNWVQTSTVEGAISQVITLWRFTLSTRARTMLATSTNLPEKGIFVQGGNLYFEDYSGSGYIIQRTSGTSASAVTTIYTGPGTLQGMFVDSAGIYVSDYSGTTRRIARTNLDGTGLVPLSTDRASEIATDATYVYYVP